MDCIVFVPRREEVTVEWRKPHELNVRHTSTKIEWKLLDGACSAYGGEERHI
jgi:hypothetical protein